MPNNSEQGVMTLSDLSSAELKLVFLLRNMGDFEKIEVKKTNEGISIVSTATTKEIFHE